jgi:hypothetical protein
LQRSPAPRSRRRYRRGFIGLSLEYKALPAYAGTNPAAVDPVFEQLIRNLAPGPGAGAADRRRQHRFDLTWWRVPGVAHPPVVTYTLTHDWIRTTAALTKALGAKLILGINLAINSPKLAGAEAQALLAGLGRQSIAALEIGNEPDIYQLFPAYKTSQGKIVHVRGKGYDFTDFTRQFAAVRQALPQLPIAGPALGGSGSGWASDLGQFINDEPGLSLVTVHQYPLLGCNVPTSASQYPAIRAPNQQLRDRRLRAEHRPATRSRERRPPRAPRRRAELRYLRRNRRRQRHVRLRAMGAGHDVRARSSRRLWREHPHLPRRALRALLNHRYRRQLASNRAPPCTTA